MYKPLLHSKVLITAGPTREYWDPVRYITNASSGAMGLALAAAARRLGAKVTVVLGPSSAPSPQPPAFSRDFRVVPVVSAWDMCEAVKKRIQGTAIFIGAAAVVDYRPANILKRKFKRHHPSISLRLAGNPDIVAMVGHLGRERPQCVVGFALETDHLLKNARKKLMRKRMDWIVANRMSNMGDTEGAAILLSRWGDRASFRRMPKDRLARKIWETILDVIPARRWPERHKPSVRP